MSPVDSSESIIVDVTDVFVDTVAVVVVTVVLDVGDGDVVGDRSTTSESSDVVGIPFEEL